jgi:hypothetical protein
MGAIASVDVGLSLDDPSDALRLLDTSGQPDPKGYASAWCEPVPGSSDEHEHTSGRVRKPQGTPAHSSGAMQFPVLRHSHQGPASLVQQSCVGREGSRLVLCRRVDIDHRKRRLRHGLSRKTGLYGQAQNELAARLTNTFTKPCHQTRINRQCMLEVPLATKILPERVLYPRGDNLLIGAVVGVLEHLQSNHQANWMPWAANASRVQAAKACFAC